MGWESVFVNYFHLLPTKGPADIDDFPSYPVDEESKDCYHPGVWNQEFGYSYRK